MSSIGVQLTKSHMFKDKDEVGDKGVTVRQPSTAVLAIDSADRYSTYTPLADPTKLTNAYQFTISRNQSLMNGLIKRIALTEIVFPFYIPNINSYTNAVYFKKNGGPTVTAYLPIGFYGVLQMAGALQTLLRANGFPSAQVTVPEIALPAGIPTPPPSCLLIRTVTADTIQFVRGAGNPASTDNTSVNDFQYYDLVNMTDAVGTTINTNSSRFKYMEYIDVVCSELTNNQKLKDNSTALYPRNVLARVYVENEDNFGQVAITGNASRNAFEVIPGIYPFTIYRQFKNPKFIEWNEAQPIGSLTFELYDNHGKLLTQSVAPGQFNSKFVPDWRMTLLVSEN